MPKLKDVKDIKKKWLLRRHPLPLDNNETAFGGARSTSERNNQRNEINTGIGHHDVTPNPHTSI